MTRAISRVPSCRALTRTDHDSTMSPSVGARRCTPSSRRHTSSRVVVEDVVVEDVVVEDDGGDRAKGEGERGGTPTTVRVRRGARWNARIWFGGPDGLNE